MLIRSITQNAMDQTFSIRQFPSPEHPYNAFLQKNLAVLDISRFTTGEIGPQSRLLWILSSKPRQGDVSQSMKQSRARFKFKLRQCKRDEARIRPDILADDLVK